VLQLPDARDGRAAAVRPARPGTLRVWVASAAPRPCLLADLIRRVAQRHHLRPEVWQAAPADWSALNVHPAQRSGPPPDPLDVAVTGDGLPAGPAAHVVRPGAAGPGMPEATGTDPLALRLALLSRPYQEDLALTGPDLDAAAQTLADWRRRVARWALSPSKPMCAAYTGDFLGALDDDLDSPAALRVLAALAADAGVPPGSRFESFAYFDQFLGLDLAREVGR